MAPNFASAAKPLTKRPSLRFPITVHGVPETGQGGEMTVTARVILTATVITESADKYYYVFSFSKDTPETAFAFPGYLL